MSPATLPREENSIAAIEPFPIQTVYYTSIGPEILNSISSTSVELDMSFLFLAQSYSTSATQSLLPSPFLMMEKGREDSTPVNVKNKKIMALIDKWLTVDSDYDEKVWPLVKESIENNRLSDRRRFNE